MQYITETKKHKEVEYSIYLQKDIGSPLDPTDSAKILITIENEASNPCVGKTRIGSLGSPGSSNCCQAPGVIHAWC